MAMPLQKVYWQLDFKPGDIPDQHRPVHKIVAEYCAANYLTTRITNPQDPLTLQKCLPIIAPNSTVRDELRASWLMAALGNKPIEEYAIELDPTRYLRMETLHSLLIHRSSYL
jgi:hypothetical protein